MTEERRTVVVMFAQVAGLAELPDVERAETTDAVFLRLRKIVESRGGSVDKYIGDVVMALWGAPVAHEDDGARAAQAAVEMAIETDLFASAAGKDLTLRAGMNLGEVLFGSVGGDRATAMGDPVNVAHRLMSAAEPGTILLSRAAAGAVGGAVMLRGKAALSLKGRAEAVEAFEIVPEDGPRTTLRARPDLAAPICGRAGEVDLLVARLSESTKGTPACVVLSGEPGVGKSRLAAEVRRRLRLGSPAFRSLVGNSPEDGRIPLQAPGEILREGLGAAAGRGAQPEEFAKRIIDTLADAVPREPERRALAGLILESMGLEPPGGMEASIDPARVEAETWRAWALALGSLSGERPAVFVFEDVHFADQGTRRLLTELPTLLAGRNIALLATSRTDAAAPAGWPIHTVGGIERDSLAEVAAHVLGAPLAPALADFIFQKAEGNPLFALELARYLRENNLAAGNPCELKVPPSRLPDRLTSLLTARLDGLPAAARELIKAAAVLGREFGAGMLGRVTGRETSDGLHAAAARRMVARTGTRTITGEDEWSFHHALVRDAAYQLLTKRERRSFHELAAVDLEPLTTSDPRRIGPLAARHRENAGQAEPAARLWNAAARSALQHRAWIEALSDAQEAIRLGLPEGRLAAADALVIQGRLQEGKAECDALLADASTPTATRAAAHLSLAKAYSRMGELQQSLASAEESARLDPTPGNVMQSTLWQSAALGRLERPHEALKKLESTRPLGDPPPELLREFGNCYASLGRYEEAEQAIQVGLKSAEARGDFWTIAMSSNSLGLVRLRSARPEEAISWFERAREAFRDSADRAGSATAMANLALAFNRCDRRADAEAPLREALEIRIQIGDRAGIASCKGLLADAASNRGDWEAAVRLESEVVEMAQQLRHASMEAGARVHLGNTLFLRGWLRAALESYERAFGIISKIRDPLSVAACTGNIGMVHHLLGEGSLALPFLEESLRQRIGLGHQSRADEVRIEIAEAQALRGATREALHALDPVLAGTGEYRGIANALAARIYSAAGKHDQAAEHARAFTEGAADLDSDTNALLHLGICHLRHAQWSLAHTCLRKALEDSVTPGGTSVGMHARIGLGGLALRERKIEEARSHATQALETARLAGDRNRERESLLLLARCHARDGNRAEASRFLGMARALPDVRLEDLEPRIEGLVALAVAGAEAGEVGNAEKEAAEARGLAKQAGLEGLTTELEGMP